MKPKDAFGRYGCVPRDLHPAWFTVGWSARSIGMALFSLVDDFETRRIEVHGDWMDSLCKRLCIGGKERRFAKPALQALVEAGLVTVLESSVRIETRPVEVRSLRVDSAIAPQNAQSTDSDGTSKTTQVPEIVHGAEVQLVKQQSKASERDARARESSARFDKPPVGETPPELPKPASNPPSWLRVWQLFAAHRGLDPLQLGHPGRQQAALESIAASAEVEAGAAQGESFDRAVQRLLGAWSADKWVQQKQPTLANLAENLHRYARARIAKVMPFPAEESLFDKQKRWAEEAVACPAEWKIGGMS